MNEILQKYVEVVPVIKDALGLDIMMSITDGYHFLDYWRGDKMVADIKPGDELNHEDPMWQVFQTGQKLEAIMPASVYGFEFRAIMIPIKDGRETIGTMGIAISLENETFTANAADELLQNITNAHSNMDIIQSSTDSISEKSAVLENATNKLLQNITEIHNTVNEIKAISSKTNMLALNASIEAARSGEAGRGFAVVAESMRNLAMNTTESTAKILEILKAINLDVDEMQTALTGVSKEQENQNRNTAELINEIKQIESMTAEIADRMKVFGK